MDKEKFMQKMADILTFNDYCSLRRLINNLEKDFQLVMKQYPNKIVYVNNNEIVELCYNFGNKPSLFFKCENNTLKPIKRHEVV